MNHQQIHNYIARQWESSIVPELMEYIKIPNKSPAFDPDWQSHGYMELAMSQFCDWLKQQPLTGMQFEVVRLQDRTPLLYVEIEGTTEETVLLYGHLDKQPEMSGWREDLSPFTPKLESEKLYGRGGADDGYAFFASITAIAALQVQAIPHARCVIIIEACEESGSYDLPPYMAHLSDRIGSPSLVVCLDSGCGNYEQLWMTSSLRGLIGGELTVQVLDEGVHSGDASGVVPSSFRIMRQLLDRIEDASTGEIIIDALHVDIPESRIQQAKQAANSIGDAINKRFPLTNNTDVMHQDTAELILNRSWRPALSYIGIGNIPGLQSAGNVLRPKTSIKLSMRLPPSCNAESASRCLKDTLESDPPCNATVQYTPDWAADGWVAPEVASWLEQSLQEASETYFNKPAVFMGEGWSIPFMGMLGEQFPTAQFVITGVLGPGSNAHGPNEFLHLPMAERLTCCIAHVIADHYRIHKSSGFTR